MNPRMPPPVPKLTALSVMCSSSPLAESGAPRARRGSRVWRSSVVVNIVAMQLEVSFECCSGARSRRFDGGQKKVGEYDCVRDPGVRCRMCGTSEGSRFPGAARL